MCTTIQRLVIGGMFGGVCLGVSPGGTALALAQAVQGEPAFRPLVRTSDKNTLVFEHATLTVGPRKDRLMVLSADHGGYFQVVFTCTAPEYFTYTIEAHEPREFYDTVSAQAGSDMVTVSGPLTTRGVTMRHDRRYAKYRVSVALRPGIVTSSAADEALGTAAHDKSTTVLGRSVPRQVVPGVQLMAGASTSECGAAGAEGRTLFSVSFDLWVETRPEWRLGVIAGVGRSGLTNRRYAIRVESDGGKTFVDDHTQDSLAVDMMALANAYYTRTFFRAVNLGVSFGLGTSGTTPRFFFGPSITLGKYFVLHGGWAAGTVSAPPVGQEMGRPPVNGDNTLNSLSTRVTGRPYVGIGFTWVDRADSFASALTAATTASGSIGSCITSVPSSVEVGARAGMEVALKVEAGADCHWTAYIAGGTPGVAIKKGSEAGTGSAEIVLVAGPAVLAPLTARLMVTGPVGSAPKVVEISRKPTSCLTVDSTALTFQSGAVTLTVTADNTCSWAVRFEGASGGFLVPGIDTEQTGERALTIAPPPGASEATLLLEGPKGAEPVKVLLKKP